jgi:biotin operon repressor
MSKQKRILKTTFKKQKFVGVTTLVDPSTGVAYPMQINSIEDRDFNFHKVWLEHMIMGLEGIANQKLSLAFWIIENLDGDNRLIMTQEAISEETGICRATISKTINILCKCGENGISFLQKIQNGVYRVNPDILYKGSHNNRMGIIFEYSQQMMAKAKKEHEKDIIIIDSDVSIIE